MDSRSRVWFLSGATLLAFVLLCGGLAVRVWVLRPTEPGNVTEAEVTEATKASHVVEPATKGKVAEPAGPGQVTEANFAKIRNGMTRAEVDGLLGREHRFTGDGEPRVKFSREHGPLCEERIYEKGKWPLGKRAIIAFEMPAFTVKDKEFLSEPSNPGHVTEANFAMIRKGMSRKEVDALLGREHWCGIFGTVRWSEVSYQEGSQTVHVRFDGRAVSEKSFAGP